MSKFRRILLAVDRRFDDERLLQAVLADLYRDSPDAVLVLGDGETGSEQLADQIWLGTVERHPADWKHHDSNCPPAHLQQPICRRAEFRRDLERIALGADLCVALHGPRPVGAGSNTAHLAERAGIPTRHFPETADDLASTRHAVEIPALSIRQPWAGLIMSGIKTVENRTWQTNHRGRVVVHASKQWDAHGENLAALLGHQLDRKEAVHGYLGTVELVDVHLDRGCCRPWGEPNAYHWTVEAPKEFTAPASGPGRLRLFTPPSEIVELCHLQLAESSTKELRQ